MQAKRMVCIRKITQKGAQSGINTTFQLHLIYKTHTIFFILEIEVQIAVRVSRVWFCEVPLGSSCYVSQ